MEFKEITSFFLLRPREQVSLGVLVGISLLAIWGTWWLHRDSLVLWDRSPTKTAQFVIDINSATEPEWTQLSGIGRTLAQRIVRYRNEHGPFSTKEELQNVHGIGSLTSHRLFPNLLPIPSTVSPTANP